MRGNPASATRPHSPVTPQHPRAFTVTEILVVIGIIVLLVGILLPTIVNSRKAARRAQISLNLQAISTALDAYKQDFGDYPRLPPEGYPATVAPSGTNPGGPPGTSPNVYGAQLLCWALIAPANDKPSANDNPNHDCDGADGPGFRVLRSPTPRQANVPANGRVYGPYLDDKFKLYKKKPDGTDATNPNEWMIADAFEHPILYYPAAPKASAASPTVDHGYVWEYAGLPAPTRVIPMFNSTHNDTDNTHPAGVSLAQLQSRLGAVAKGGTNEGAVAKGQQPQPVPYLLWSAGPDGLFGAPDPKAVNLDPTMEPKDNRGADDVTNLSAGG